MPFVRAKNIEGLIWQPEETGCAKKHNCKDCFSCQWCSDERCSLCLREKNCPAKKSRSRKTGQRRKDASAPGGRTRAAENI